MSEYVGMGQYSLAVMTSIASAQARAFLIEKLG